MAIKWVLMNLPAQLQGVFDDDSGAGFNTSIKIGEVGCEYMYC